MSQHGNANNIIALLPGEELSEQKVSAMNPVIRYVVQLPKAAQITFDVKESNTASRAALYLSQVEDFPSAKNASWSCESSRPRKTVVLLPIDERFRVGPCYLSVWYTGTSGVSFFSLRVTMKEQYVARWPFAGSMSIYDGEWRLDKRHGRGRVVYYDDPKRFEQAVGGSADLSGATMRGIEDASTLEAVNAATESIDTQVRLLAQSFLAASGGADGGGAGNSLLLRSAAAQQAQHRQQARPRGAGTFDIPDGGSEFYDGEWVDGE